MPVCISHLIVSGSVTVHVGPHVSLSMGFSRHPYWSGLPCPPQDLPDLGIKLRSPALQADSLPSEPQRKPERMNV